MPLTVWSAGRAEAPLHAAHHTVVLSGRKRDGQERHCRRLTGWSSGWESALQCRGWDAASIPNQGTKISHATRQLSLHAQLHLESPPAARGESAAVKTPRATTEICKAKTSSSTKILLLKKEQHCPVGWSAVKTIPRVSAVHCGCHWLHVATAL